jgi:hypothetical protein
MSNWQERFDALLKAMSQGEPHKAEKRAEAKNARDRAQGDKDGVV